MIQHEASVNGANTWILIKARTPFGNTEMVINCTREQYERGCRAYQGGKMMQDAFRFLSADEREFLISGMTPAQFDEATLPEEIEECWYNRDIGRYSDCDGKFKCHCKEMFG